MHRINSVNEPLCQTGFNLFLMLLLIVSVLFPSSKNVFCETHMFQEFFGFFCQKKHITFFLHSLIKHQNVCFFSMLTRICRLHRGTADWFGVSKDNDSTQRWRRRSLQHCSNLFGGLKTQVMREMELYSQDNLSLASTETPPPLYLPPHHPSHHHHYGIQRVGQRRRHQVGALTLDGHSHFCPNRIFHPLSFTFGFHFSSDFGCMFSFGSLTFHVFKGL